MSEKRLNNTIFLMYLVTENYRKTHNMSIEDFLKFDEKYDVCDEELEFGQDALYEYINKDI